MRLLIIFPSANRGGAENYALTIAAAAIKDGWEVHAAFPKTAKTASLIQDFQDRGILYHALDIAPVGGHHFKLFREHLPQLLRTLVLLTRLKPDAIHLTLPWAYYGFDSLLAAGLLKIPTLVAFQLYPRRFFYSNPKIKAFAWARSRHQKWVAISENNRTFISESFEVAASEISLIYNGTQINSEQSNLTQEQTHQLRQAIRQELGIPLESPILLTVGRLSRIKGYAELIEVVPSIIQEFPQVKFVWVGEGDLEQYLIQRAKTLGVQDNVLLLGYRLDVPKLLTSADIFVFPTHFEGLPFAIIEAIAHQLPVIASDASSIPEVIENKVQGILFPSKDKESLRNAIIWALQHPQEMEKMAENARPKLEAFSEEKMIQQTLGLIREITA